MRSFGTEGRVRPEHHYIVPRTEEIIDFIRRVKKWQVHRPLCTAPDREDHLLPIGSCSTCRERPNLFSDSIGFPNDAQRRPYHFL